MNVGIPPPGGAPPAHPPLRFEVDDQHPWLGLDAFTEELSGYFFGRTDEVEELFRRVKREPLTVLFGISGLGKTSLVRAGLFPALLAEGFFAGLYPARSRGRSEVLRPASQSGVDRCDHRGAHRATDAPGDRRNALGIFPSQQSSAANLERPTDHSGAGSGPIRGTVHPWRPRADGPRQL
jgi:hypothetical protein